MTKTININCQPSPTVPRVVAVSTDPVPPDGYLFLVDETGKYVTDENGAFVVVPIG